MAEAAYVHAPDDGAVGGDFDVSVLCRFHEVQGDHRVIVAAGELAKHPDTEGVGLRTVPGFHLFNKRLTDTGAVVGAHFAGPPLVFGPIVGVEE